MIDFDRYPDQCCEFDERLFVLKIDIDNVCGEVSPEWFPGVHLQFYLSIEYPLDEQAYDRTYWVAKMKVTKPFRWADPGCSTVTFVINEDKDYSAFEAAQLMYREFVLQPELFTSPSGDQRVTWKKGIAFRWTTFPETLNILQLREPFDYEIFPCEYFTCYRPQNRESQFMAFGYPLRRPEWMYIERKFVVNPYSVCVSKASEMSKGFQKFYPESWFTEETDL